MQMWKMHCITKHTLKAWKKPLQMYRKSRNVQQDAVDAMREKGLRAGLLKIRVFRPFPAEEIADALKHCRAIAIMDRSEGYNAVGGPLGAEVTAALYRAKTKTEVVNIMYGLSGRDVRVEDLEEVFDNLVKLGDGEKVYDETCPYLGLRE